ncbi:YscQ/HrcQ family type III secretion apparatus protein [Yersinia bercovieri]|uniref:YscQ/HrcQ family type III secretion apparatus protein n=2 Tax=Yersinia bercovieri TaxID=634 RepID=A0A2G4TZZ5_YERBE|nr:YscQ/HrcQ family type III secretion apparatus protein [Yersinia bercovieri]MCB5303649.1 YscQ/HrcQ family type III secretion apparatus protein [Yersinia bercovieri]PHZ26631.1 YscQ/HrcQ family type III secretion apparatus protein [Yersinia bercovieri]QKJ06839.1 YscQ/HrcQ family type III secretion apparatus protein [Yersinia bercovieri ATCC 43970]
MLACLTAELRQLSAVIGRGRQSAGVTATLMLTEGEGVYLPLHYSGEACGIWLSRPCWQNWLASSLATDDPQVLASELVVAMANWALNPLLTPLPDLVIHSQLPQPMTLLSQWVVTLTFELEGEPLSAVLLDWPLTALADTLSDWQGEQAPAQEMQWQASLLVGWCRLSLSQLQQLRPGDGVRVTAAAALEQGNCWLWQMASPQIYIKLEEGNQMTIQQINDDIDHLLALDTAALAKEPQPLVLDHLPQTLVMEIGRIAVPLGEIKQLAVGQTLNCQTSVYGEVNIRLNGQPVGSGSLLRCGEDLVVRIDQWHLTLRP